VSAQQKTIQSDGDQNRVWKVVCCFRLWFRERVFFLGKGSVKSPVGCSSVQSCKNAVVVFKQASEQVSGVDGQPHSCHIYRGCTFLHNLAGSLYRKLHPTDNRRFHRSSIRLLLGSSGSVRGLEFFIEPRLSIPGRIHRQELEFVSKSSGKIRLRIYCVVVENSDSRLSKVANDCLAGVSLASEEGVAFVGWYNPLGGENTIDRSIDLTDASDMIHALHEVQFLTRKVSINRGVPVSALIAFAVQETGRVYLATYPNPRPILAPFPNTKPVPQILAFHVQGGEFSQLRPKFFELIPSDWNSFNIRLISDRDAIARFAVSP